ncbi:MAG: hypothetical protein K1X28_05880 [Parachlamydiales bacterium]|nr:hypothetical protein [Parachlamydiales bacterium]
MRQPLDSYREEKAQRRQEPASGVGAVLCTAPCRARAFSKRDEACWARGCGIETKGP